MLLIASPTCVSHKCRQREDRSGSLALTRQAILSTSALSALRFETGSIALVCCAFFLSFLASTFLFQLEVRTMCTMTGELVVL